MQYVPKIRQNIKNDLINASPINLTSKSIGYSESYTAMTGCVFEHVILNTKLSVSERLYYILVDSLCLINASCGKQRSIALSSQNWASILGCSKFQVLLMQQNLESLGYFKIIREKNKLGGNKRNLITATLPNSVFDELKGHSNKKGEHLPYNEELESKRSYLDRTKLFIPLNYSLLKSMLFDKSLTSQQKTIFLYLSYISYKSYIKNKEANSPNPNVLTKPLYRCTISYNELIKLHGLSKFSLSRIMSSLEQKGLISRHRIFIKKEDQQEMQDRCDKSLWVIDINSSLVANVNSYNVDVNNEVACINPDVAKFIPHNNKFFITKNIKEDRSNNSSNFLKENKKDRENNKENKESDKSQKQCGQDRERKQLQLEKKGYSSLEHNNNQLNKFNDQKKLNTENSNTDDHCINTKKIQNKVINLKRRKIEEFYPLDESDSIALRKLSNRDFSLSYINKLILHIAKKKPDHSFYTKKLFISYMVKILIYEMRDAEQVNKIDFKFKNNCISAIDQNQQHEHKSKTTDQAIYQNKYLEKIENNQDVSTLAQLKRKIAARFDCNVAYKILTSCYFVGLSETGDDQSDRSNNKFIIKAKDYQNITSVEQELLLDQIRAVYGQDIDELKFIEQKPVPRLKLVQSGPDVTNSVANNKEAKPSSHCENNNDCLEKDHTDSVAYGLEQYLEHNLGRNVYRAWFNKVKIIVKNIKVRNINNQEVDELSVLIETATSLVAEWIKSNYLIYIQQYCRSISCRVVIKI